MAKPTIPADMLYKVDSSMVYALGYNQATQELDVVFWSGKIYRYIDVPLEVFEQCLASDSVGQYLRGCVIGCYAEQKLRR